MMLLSPKKVLVMINNYVEICVDNEKKNSMKNLKIDVCTPHHSRKIIELTKLRWKLFSETYPFENEKIRNKYAGEKILIID